MMTPKQRADLEATVIPYHWNNHPTNMMRIVSFVESLLAQERAATVERCATISEDVSRKYPERGNRIAAAIRQGGGNGK